MKKKIYNEIGDIVSEVKLTYHSKTKVCERIFVNNSRLAYQLLMMYWDKDKLQLQEESKLVLLDHCSRVIAVSSISSGGRTETIFDPRVIFAIALKTAAVKIMLAHNHPSGQLRPSQADIDITRKIRAGGQILDIHLIDSLIVSTEGYFSFTDSGLL